VLANPIPGTPASVLSAVLVTDPGHPPAPGDRHRATFSTTNFPTLPSLMNEVVWLPQYALLDCNGEFTGMLVSLGWATKGVTAVTAAYTPLPSDALILVSAAGGPVTVTLPDATQAGYSPGQRYTIKKTDTSTNAVTVSASAGQLIDGAASVTLTGTSGYLSVVFDGVNSAAWWTWAGYTTVGTSPTGTAGGALSGTYPNPGLAVPLALSAGSAASLLTVTNTTAAPSSPAVKVTSAAAGDQAAGAQVSGDGFLRFLAGSDGKLQWGPGNVTQDTDLYRASAGVLKTDGTLNAAGGLQAGGLAVGALDTAAADIQPIGVQSAGTTGKAADAGHAHAANASLSLYTAPVGATAETMSRASVTGTSSALTSGTLYVMAAGMAKGTAVGNLTFCVRGTAEAGGTHAWYVLLDSGLVVRAVTADQTGAAALGTTNTPFTFATNAYTTTYGGLFYVGICVVATTMPLMLVGQSTPQALSNLSPVLCGSSSAGLTTPPATGTTMGALTGNNGYNFYAYTS